MEELQSTEALDREILEDARKKAARILRAADEALAAKSAEWERTAAASLDELDKKYARLRELAAGEIMARLPMDKRRAKAEKIESLLNAAVDAWFAGLSRERIIDLLKKETAKRLAVAGASGKSVSSGKPAASGEWRVLISGIDTAEAKTIVKAVLPDADCAFEAMPVAGKYPELVLETKELRITASIFKTVDFFLHEKRAELAEALLGQAVLAGEEA